MLLYFVFIFGKIKWLLLLVTEDGSLYLRIVQSLVLERGLADKLRDLKLKQT